MNNTDTRLDELERRIKSRKFRENKGRANEVNYWIFDYPPEDELKVRDRIEYIKSKSKRDDYEIFEVDLYDFIIDRLEEKGYLEKCFQFEKRRGFEQINRAISNLLKFNDKNSTIVEYINNNASENSIVFLTGIGKAFPILRSHKILNTLGQVFSKSPVILFFPGTYDKQSLKLFNEFTDNNYYRAFKLVE